MHLIDVARSLRQAAGPLVGIGFFAYLGYHAVHGDRGIFALRHYQTEVEQASALLSTLEEERRGLENRVSLLHPESLDLDMLEERARVVLNYVHPDDLVIPRARGASGLSPTPAMPTIP